MYIIMINWASYWNKNFMKQITMDTTMDLVFSENFHDSVWKLDWTNLFIINLYDVAML